MKKKAILFSLMMGLLAFLLGSCGGGNHHYGTTSNTKNVKGAAMKDFLIGAKVAIYDATGAKVDDGNCLTGKFGVFNCAISKSAQAPYTVVISGGKLDKDGLTTTDNDSVAADNVTLATVIPSDTTPTVANPITTAVLLNEAGTDNVSALGEKSKDLAKKSGFVESSLKSLGGLVYVNVDNDTALQDTEEKVTEIVKAYDSKNFDNTTGVYTGDIDTIIQKLQEDVSDGALDGKKDNESLKDVDNQTVEIPDNVTKGLPKSYTTSVTIGGVTDDNLTDNVTINNAEPCKKEVKVKVTTENVEAGTYSVEVTFYVKDKNGKREMTATLQYATVTVGSDGKISAATVPADAKVLISGKDASGSAVEGSLTNIAADTISVSNGELSYNVANVEKKLASYTGSDLSALKEVFVENGSFDIMIALKGLGQFTPVYGTVTVGTYQCGAGDCLQYCQDNTSCTGAGGLWENGECIAPGCSSSHLEYCNSEADCSGASGYWYNNQCNAEPQPQCDANHLNLCTTQTDCENADGYWYDNKCNSEAQQLPAATATVEKTGDVTGTANGVIGFKAKVTLPSDVTCDNCTYIWDLDSDGKVNGAVGTNTVTAYFGQDAQQGTATVYVVNANEQCVAKGTYSYDLSGDPLGATPPQALDLVSLNSNEQNPADVPSCQ